MIELIVVILVIAILSSLLLVGVQAAVGRAREAAVGVDIKNLEQGIKEFQSKFSITDPPPSSLILFERADDWDDFSAGMNTQQNAAVIRKLWPNFLKSDGKPSGDVDLNGNGTAGDAGAFHLNGAQCLAFLLGGVMEKDGSQYLPHGFSTNPNNPFYRPSMPTDSWGARIGPFVPLQPSRLIDDVTGVESCFPVYLDAFPGSQRPYQYFSAYGGRGYRPFGLDYVDPNIVPSAATADDEVLWDGSRPTLWSVYLQKDNVTDNAKLPRGTPWAAKSFQIISAGADGQWGVGGVVSDDGVPLNGAGTYRSDRGVERDNLTSFKGRLN